MVETKKNLNKKQISIAASLSSGITRALCQPFDVLKIRFQLQSVGNKYTTLSQAFFKIIHEEGVRALWKGHVPAQVLSIGYGVVQFSTWELLNNMSKQYDDKSFIKQAISFSAGASAGFVATILTFPCDVLRTRLVAQTHNEKTYNGIIHAFQYIRKNEGYRTFYKGLYPTLIQVVPYTGTQFMFYRMFTTIYSNCIKNYIPNEIISKYNLNFVFSSSLICGAAAGLCGKLVVYPLDLARKRIQIQGMQNWIFVKHQFHCRGLIECIVLTIRFEGFRGVYKGVAAAALKAIFTSGLQFATYDSICLILRESNLFS